MLEGDRMGCGAGCAVAALLLLAVGCAMSSPASEPDGGGEDAGRDGGSSTPATVGLFVPEAGGPADVGGTPPTDRFDASATWIGAERPGTPAGEEWWAGWTDFEGRHPVPEDCRVVDADITSDTRWNGRCYALAGVIYVRDGAVLTIGPGVTVTGGDGRESYLVVTTEGRIDARGTADAPIVFTSHRPPRERRRADIGGLFLLGLAPINAVRGVDFVEGVEPGLSRGGFGGSDPEHDCGTLRYVRIEYGSYNLFDEAGPGALTIAGCGSATELDHVMTAFGETEGIDVRGGAARLRHVVVYAPNDDAVDVSLGFSGTLQYALLVLDDWGDKAFEWDNNGDGRRNAPFTDPELWNVTAVGHAVADDGVEPDVSQEAFRAREGTRGRIHNVLMQDFAEDQCVEVAHVETKTNVEDGTLTIRDSLFVNCQTDLRFVVGDDCTDDEPTCPSIGDPLVCPNDGTGGEYPCELADGSTFTPPWLSDPSYGNAALAERLVATLEAPLE